MLTQELKVSMNMSLKSSSKIKSFLVKIILSNLKSNLSINPEKELGYCLPFSLYLVTKGNLKLLKINSQNWECKN